MSIQSILFSKDQWTKNKAINWLKRYGYKHSKIHITDNYLRFRQSKPNLMKKKRILEVRNGVKFIYEF